MSRKKTKIADFNGYPVRSSDAQYLKKEIMGNIRKCMKFLKGMQVFFKLNDRLIKDV
ncbi:MAG: hypothetical protein AB1453_08735 [Chloroflexota bacterium]